jgi:hypothetical protein
MIVILIYHGHKPIDLTVSHVTPIGRSLYFSEYSYVTGALFQGYSCVDLLNAGMRDSGVYYLQIRGTTYWFLKVYCEQEVAEGGWTVSTRNKTVHKLQHE